MNYNNGFNNGGFNNVYTPPESYSDYEDGYNQDNNRKPEGNGCLGTIVAFAILLFLIYVLLNLLDVDVKKYIEKYIPGKDSKVEEKVEDKDDKKEVKSVKEQLKSYCSKLDDEGNYNVGSQNEEDILNGNINYCMKNECMFGVNSDAKKVSNETDESESTDKVEDSYDFTYEENVIYTYSCETEIYTEMPRDYLLDELRINEGCSHDSTSEIYEKEYSDGVNIRCESSVCTLTGSLGNKVVSCGVEEEPVE